MKTLIAIISCLEYARNGINQSLRDTWITRSSLEHRFFLGDGTTVEETAEFEATWKARGSRYVDKPHKFGIYPLFPK